MKVLFICSGNNKFEDSPIVTNQGNSLLQAGLEIEYFFIKGRGVSGYAKSYISLRWHLRKNKYDLIHAHYSLSGFIASLAGKEPLIISLMGSDVHHHGFYHLLIKAFSKWRCSALVVKSEKMKSMIGIEPVYVIPNGVDMTRFKPTQQEEARRRIGFTGKKYVIFVGNPDRPEKNFNLAQKAIGLLADLSVKMDVVTQKPHDMLTDFINAADVLLLTSIYEGSPNVIKEAMACNCPIVATDVGDIRWVIGDTAGCFLASFAPEDVAAKVKMALDFGQRTNGRERLIALGLDHGSIAKRIIRAYESVIKKSKRIT